MKKPPSRIRHEISKLQEQLRIAEAREAERIGRLALKAGLGDMEIEKTELQAALESLATRFCARQGLSSGGKWRDGESSAGQAAIASGAPQGSNGEA